MTTVFLHGWGGNVTSWDKNIPYLQSKGHACFAIKMPGFDLPEPNPSWGIPEYSQFVVREIRYKLGNGRCVLVGHSFGGRLAVYIASRHPELVEKLVLTDSAGLNLEPKIIRTTLLLLSSYLRKLEETLGPLPSLRKVAVGLLGSRNYKSASPVMREVMKRVVNLDLSFCLPKINCETLIVWGEKDTTTTLATAEALKSGISNSTLEIIKGAGHNAHSTHSKEWNSCVAKFMSHE